MSTRGPIRCGTKGSTRKVNSKGRVSSPCQMAPSMRVTLTIIRKMVTDSAYALISDGFVAIVVVSVFTLIVASVVAALLCGVVCVAWFLILPACAPSTQHFLLPPLTLVCVFRSLFCFRCRHGVTVANMTAYGRTTKCTDEGCSPGPIENVTRYCKNKNHL